MVKRGSSIGFLGRFGRSEDLRLLDAALEQAGLAAAAIPEGVKLAAVGLMVDGNAPEPPPAAYRPVGDMMAFCALGEQAFARRHGAAGLAILAARMEAAIAAGDGADARIILLMLHAGLIDPELLDSYGIEAEREE